MRRAFTRISLWKAPQTDAGRMWRSQIYLQLENNSNKDYYQPLIREQLESITTSFPDYKKVEIFLQKMAGDSAQDKTSHAQKILDLLQDSTNPQDYDHAANVLLEWENYHQALEVYNKAIAAFPDYEQAWTWLYQKGNVNYLLKKPWPDIESPLRQALKMKRAPTGFEYAGLRPCRRKYQPGRSQSPP